MGWNWYIYNPDYSHIYPPNVSIVEFKRNKILFVTDDKKKFETIHEETYEEALEKLKKGKIKPKMQKV